jgi:hypothetical protein
MAKRRLGAVIILNIGILRFLSPKVSNSKKITIANMAQKTYQVSFQRPMMLSWFWLMPYAVLNPRTKKKSEIPWRLPKIFKVLLELLPAMKTEIQ